MAIENTENTRVKGTSRKRSRKTSGLIACTVVLGLALVLAGAYTVMAQKYKTAFFPNTVINGIDASGLTVEQVKQLIAVGVDGYSLTLEKRGGGEEQISAEEIALHPEFDGRLEQMIAAQNPVYWGKHLIHGTVYTIETMVVYDHERLRAAVADLDCLADENSEAPKDACMSDYISGVGYQIIPEEKGSKLDKELVFAGVSEAIMNLKNRISLEELDAYIKPQITAEDPALNAQTDTWNRYVSTKVTYRFGDRSEVLDGETLNTWLVDDGHGGVLVDDGKVAEYVTDLAQKYNTAYKPKKLKTSYGTTVTINGGNYGWRINQNAEAAALIQILQSGESQEREPIYSQTAAAHGENDYGDTYVEINLAAQQLYFYKNGDLIVQSDLVSGNEARGWSTPAGAYPLTYKQRNATLRGEGYATPVSYWMPFNGGIGMHDASWRGKFGGSIYKTSGSHGCINLPRSVAKTIYENISAGMPVLCYHLGGTAAKKASAAPVKTVSEPVKTSAAPPMTTASAVETEAEQQTEPAESAASSEAPQETVASGSANQPLPEGPAGATQPAAGPSSETTAAEPTSSEPPETTAETSSPVQGPGGREDSAPSGSKEPAGPGMSQESEKTPEGPWAKPQEGESSIVHKPGM